MDFLVSSNFSYTIISFITFLVIANLLTQRKRPSSMIAWIVVIIFLPYLGILLYLIFHGRKMSNVVKKLKKFELLDQRNLKKSFDNETEKLIYKNSLAYSTLNKSFYLCENGNDSYQKLIELILNAKESIYISAYIFAKDDLSKKILKLLAKKAREGVEVKVLIDAIGSFSLELNPSFLNELKESSAEYRFFMSVLKHPLSSKLNLRNHRKMVIVDHYKLFSGGINIAREYFQDSDGFEDTWKDISFVVEGASALEYEKIFFHNWSMVEEVDNRQITKNQPPKGEHIIQVVPSGPDIMNDTLYEAVLNSIYNAKTKIYITTPYFAPESSLIDALVVAKHRGVDVKIITPKSSDHLFVDLAKDAFLRELSEEGIEVLFYKNRMLHAKVFVVDDKLAILGSANFDSRSFFYNFEIVSFFYLKKDIEKISGWIETLFDECEYGMKKISIMQKIFENLFKILAPAL